MLRLHLTSQYTGPEMQVEQGWAGNTNSFSKKQLWGNRVSFAKK